MAQGTKTYERVVAPRASNDLIAIWEYLAHAASEATADDALRGIDRVTTALEDWPGWVRRGTMSVLDGGL